MYPYFAAVNDGWYICDAYCMAFVFDAWAWAMVWLALGWYEDRNGDAVALIGYATFCAYAAAAEL